MKFIIYTAGTVPKELRDFGSAVEAKKYAKSFGGFAEPYVSSMYKMILDGKLPRPKNFVEVQQ